MEKTTNQEPMTRETGRKTLEEILRSLFPEKEMKISLACTINAISEKMETGDDDKALEKKAELEEEWKSDKAEGNKHIDALLSILEKWDNFLYRTDKLAEKAKEELLLKHQEKENLKN